MFGALCGARCLDFSSVLRVFLMCGACSNTANCPTLQICYSEQQETASHMESSHWKRRFASLLASFRCWLGLPCTTVCLCLRLPLALIETHLVSMRTSAADHPSLLFSCNNCNATNVLPSRQVRATLTCEKRSRQPTWTRRASRQASPQIRVIPAVENEMIAVYHLMCVESRCETHWLLLV